MKSLIFTALLTFSLHSIAKNELFCSILNDSSSSTLRVTYDDTLPTFVALKSPDSDEYRNLMMTVKAVVPINKNGYESFSAQPFIDEEIDWEKEDKCFKDIGTQWYFEFNHKTSVFRVQLLPYFEKETKTCRTPRVQPQEKTLDCFY